MDEITRNHIDVALKTADGYLAEIFDLIEEDLHPEAINKVHLARDRINDSLNVLDTCRKGYK